MSKIYMLKRQTETKMVDEVVKEKQSKDIKDVEEI